MLVLTRKLNQKILIGDNVVISVVGINRDRVRIGIDAPKEIPVDREEIRKAKEENPKIVTEGAVTNV